MTQGVIPRVILLCAALTGLAGARTWVVSNEGDDRAAGTPEAPFRTISRGAEAAMPGDVVLVRAGVYRERVTPPRGGEEGKPITYRGEKSGTVFIRGSEEWKPRWEPHEGSVYFAVPDESLFDDDVYLDAANPFRVPLSSTPRNRDGKPEVERYRQGDPSLVHTCGQVIVNGRPLEQRPFPKELTARPGTWCFAADSGRIYVNFGDRAPADQHVEITTRRRIFAPHIRGLGHIVVEGFVMEHCGNQYPTNFWNTPKWAQAGALGLRGGHHWIVRHNVIRHANTIAMDVGSGGGDNERDPASIEGAPFGHDNLIAHNYVIGNGAAGIVGARSTRMIIRDNVILRNNTEGYIGKKRYEHAGIKCHGIVDGLIEHNYIADNPRNEGIWLDNQFPGTRVTRNVIVNNGARGIFLEMSDYEWDTALVDHNISVGNADAQFYVHDASGSTVVHNLFANSPANAKYGQGAYIYQVTERTRTGYHSLFNNLFVKHRVMLDINYPAHKGGPQRLDHNVYDAGPEDRTFLINNASDKPSPWNPEEFLAMVRKDAASRMPVVEGGKVALTMEEWQAFWKSHGLPNDTGSVLRRGVRVSYDPSSRKLDIFMPFDPALVGSTLHPGCGTDFTGRAIPQDGTARPGPFQNLRMGRNSLVVWDGLPLLAEGELP
jgi:parallel beta-helix repeat protein